jgi:hypothetical protein
MHSGEDFVMTVVRRSLTGSEQLPAAERADLFEGVGHILRKVSPKEAKAARDAAKAIREAEQCQLKFSALLAQEEAR